MAIREHTLSAFLQHSGRVLSGLGEGEILLRRRDGDDLIVMTRGQNDALGTTLRALAGVVSGGMDRAMAILPWLEFLSPEDRLACLHELGQVASAVVASGRLTQLEETLYEWEATGLAAWDERRLRERADDDQVAQNQPVALPRPFVVVMSVSSGHPKENE
jgi:hypothetical protein